MSEEERLRHELAAAHFVIGKGLTSISRAIWFVGWAIALLAVVLS